LTPKCTFIEPLTSAGELGKRLVEGKGAENVELWGKLLLTGNNGCDTDGVDEGSPGGVTCEGMSAGVMVDGTGGLTFCTGNSGCWVYVIGAGGGIETAGCCGNQCCERGGTGQPAWGAGTAEL